MPERFFRFHLSTAVLMVFTAAVLLGLNTRWRFESVDFQLSEVRYGFPIAAYRKKYFIFHTSMTRERIEQFTTVEPPWNESNEFIFIEGKGLYARMSDESDGFNLVGISVDLFFTAVILFVVAIIAEFITFKRSKARLNRLRLSQETVIE